MADASADSLKRKPSDSEGTAVATAELTEEMPEAKRLRAADLILLDIEYEDVDSAAGDLDTVLRSLEEEICVPSAAAADEEASLPSTSASSDSDGLVQPDLSYLLEASDDELGLPPAVLSSSEDGDPTEGDLEDDAKAEAAPLAQIWRFDDDLPSYYDSLDLAGFAQDGESGGADTGDLAAGGPLFDYADFSPFVPSDFPDSSWRPESLPAV